MKFYCGFIIEVAVLRWLLVFLNVKRRSQNDMYRQIDYRAESTVLVEGVASTQALLNYLLDCGTCFASSGAQAGLPPTILTPVAFTGATLCCLKVWNDIFLQCLSIFGAVCVCVVQFLPVGFNLCLLGLFCLCVVHSLCGLIFLCEVHIVPVRFSFSLYGANCFTTHHLVFFCPLPGFEPTTSYITVQHVTTRTAGVDCMDWSDGSVSYTHTNTVSVYAQPIFKKV